MRCVGAWSLDTKVTAPACGGRLAAAVIGLPNKRPAA
jgi:hypothetical protein